MRAVFVRAYGGAENLEIVETENPPAPKETQILVKVKAAALNRADVLQRRGFYPAPKGSPEKILGLEFAGEVAETGAAVEKFKIGDRVFGIAAGGAQAEFFLAEESLLSKIPENLNFIEAAAVPEAFITAHDAIFTQGNVRRGETFLVHAVGSGVGLAALQLAKANGVFVFGTSRTRDKLDKCLQFGLDAPILSGNEPDFAEYIKNETNGKGVDVILDLVGARYFGENLSSLALKGRMLLVGLTSGAKTEFDMSVALAKRLKILGTVLRSRSVEEKASATKEFAEKVLPLFEKGSIKPNVDRVFSFREARKAHEYLESNVSFGKVVLEF